ncbi:MAG TPA: DUF1501 domain-containing protein, partial [Pirellulales bacterium]|nr:DUF1501 domain-containing protein [Pirellulales bacterium]
NPNRSHFVSMNIWQSARLEESEHGQYGWLGRAIDVGAEPQNAPKGILVGPGSAPVALWGRRSTIANVKSLEDLALAAPVGILRETTGNASGELARWAAEASDSAFSTVERLSALAGHDSSSRKFGYPESQLSQQLQLVAKLIRSSSTARVYYAVQTGYDTHATQQGTHFELLRDLADGLKAFVDDLTADRLADRVLVLAFSEFGRRAAENDSEGTDHGAAAPLIVAGPTFAQSVLGPTPNLADLQDGDVKMAVDFRQVYATILDQWLAVRPMEILSDRFEPLPLIKN